LIFYKSSFSDYDEYTGALMIEVVARIKALSFHRKWN